MPRFYVPPEQIHHQRFTLTGSEAHHAARVLRKDVGDVIDLFDGKDLSFQGKIESITADRVEGTIVGQKRAAPTASTQLTLYQALIKGPRWDWLVEKASELGLTKLVPLTTARTVV